MGFKTGFLISEADAMSTEPRSQGNFGHFLKMTEAAPKSCTFFS
jgi:hypothetical protein